MPSLRLMPAVAVTEPDYGSDVAGIKVTDRAALEAAGIKPAEVAKKVWGI